jgi:hypothetical protein
LPLRRSDWITEMAWMKNTFWPRIHALALARFRRVGLETPIPAPVVTVDPPGGVVPQDTRITLTGNADLFYTTDGTDPLTRSGQPTATAVAYTEPLRLTGPLKIRAQRRTGVDTVSAVTEALFLTSDSVGAENGLEICELHYHPSAINAEAFVEVRHRRSDRWALLGGARVSGDIDATVPNGVVLGPGERGVFVADLEAFRARYGTAPRVLGRFEGALDHGGGTVRLLAPSGRVVARGTYDDTAPWPLEPDGRGPSLTLKTSLEGLNPDDPGAWRPSSVIGGTPGRGDSIVFAQGLPDDDADADGWSALEEYFHGTRDTDATDRPVRPPGIQLSGDGRVTLSIAHPLVADQAEASWEHSGDLKDWEPLATGINGSTGISGVTVFSQGLETLRWTLPADPGSQRFYRLRLKLR